MPRRQTQEIPRWRRGRPPQRPTQVIQLNGRQARALIRTIDIPQAGQAGQPASGTALRNDVLARTGAWRRRRSLPPLAWAAGVVIAGAVLGATPHPAVYGPLAGIVLAVLLILFTRHASAFARRWSDAAAFLTLAWLPALAIAGFGAPAPALLIPCLAAAAGTWWKHYRFPPKEEAQPDPEPDTTSDQAVWARIASKRRWSAWLTNPQVIPGGMKYEIAMDGVETHIGNIMGEPRAIAAAFGKPQTEAYVEPHPTGIESRGVFTRLKSGTLEKITDWDGRGISEDGFAVIGRFADSQPARIRFWVRRDGTRHGLIAGASGAGKSVLLDLIVRQAINSPVPVVPVILDPQNGQSLPQWRDKVLYAAGVEECIAMLAGLHNAMMNRSRALADMTWTDEAGNLNRGLPFFDAGITGLPAVLIIIDEAPVMFGGGGNSKLAAQAVRLAAEIGKLGRKTGVSLWPVAQVPSLAELGDQVVRSMLVGGNVVCLRTGDRVSSGMLGLHADPSVLPKFFPDGEPTGGLGYVVGPDNRQAPFRVSPVPARMRRNLPPVPLLDPAFAGDVSVGMTAANALLHPAPATASQDSDDDGPEGRRCVDAVLQVLTDRGTEMERGEIIKWTADLVKGAWEREQPFSTRSVGSALKSLAEAGKITKVREGVYRAGPPLAGTEEE
jgi:hypothetical protein